MVHSKLRNTWVPISPPLAFSLWEDKIGCGEFLAQVWSSYPASVWWWMGCYWYRHTEIKLCRKVRLWEIAIYRVEMGRLERSYHIHSNFLKKGMIAIQTIRNSNMTSAPNICWSMPRSWSQVTLGLSSSLVLAIQRPREASILKKIRVVRELC